MRLPAGVFDGVRDERGAARVMALAMGRCGVLTRVLCGHMCPVTHAGLPTPAAPGQLTMRALRGLQAQLGVICAQSFHLFGHPISASLSPLIHNTGFTQYQLPYTYTLCDTDSVDAVRAAMQVQQAVRV